MSGQIVFTNEIWIINLLNSIKLCRTWIFQHFQWILCILKYLITELVEIYQLLKKCYNWKYLHLKMNFFIKYFLKQLKFQLFRNIQKLLQNHLIGVNHKNIYAIFCWFKKLRGVIIIIFQEINNLFVDHFRKLNFHFCSVWHNI